MKNFSKTYITYIIGIIAYCLTPCINAQNTETEWQYTMPVSIYESISAGNAAQLAVHLNNTVEITMPQGTSHIYSKKQAEVILLEYLSSIVNPQFTIEHERNMPPSTLTIGSIKGNGIQHRLFILTQKHDDTILIHQLRVEETNL
ncbi:MAG: DUF4783 domain-containing protein [Bacteroidales bacterium]|nr:DUF4783 domain-containing protein [Bacteroidales bacterium]